MLICLSDLFNLFTCFQWCGCQCWLTREEAATGLACSCSWPHIKQTLRLLNEAEKLPWFSILFALALAFTSWPVSQSLSLSPSFAGTRLTVSLAIAFFPSVLRNFRTFFLPVLATPLRQPPQTHFKRFVGCGKRKEERVMERRREGDWLVLYLCWVTVWAEARMPLNRQQPTQRDATWGGSSWLPSPRLEAGVCDLNLAELCEPLLQSLAPS